MLVPKVICPFIFCKHNDEMFADTEYSGFCKYEGAIRLKHVMKGDEEYLDCEDFVNKYKGNKEVVTSENHVG